MTLGVIGAFDYDNSVNEEIVEWFDDGHTCQLDNVLRFIPSAAYLGIGFIPGVRTKHNFRDRLLVFATSHVAMAAMTYGLKYAVNEPRPFDSGGRSFPSGHVALSFTGAELLRAEYGTWYGVGGYAVAATVAFLRLYNTRHWLHDVVMGAGIGILSARIGYWLLPWEKKLFHITDAPHSPTLVAVPGYDVVSKGVTANLVITL